MNRRGAGGEADIAFVFNDKERAGLRSDDVCSADADISAEKLVS